MRVVFASRSTTGGIPTAAPARAAAVAPASAATAASAAFKREPLSIEAETGRPSDCPKSKPKESARDALRLTAPPSEASTNAPPPPPLPPPPDESPPIDIAIGGSGRNDGDGAPNIPRAAVAAMLWPPRLSLLAPLLPPSPPLPSPFSGLLWALPLVRQRGAMGRSPPISPEADNPL
eukprot:366403-Chlamydomonas_euryale.AAC.2